MVRKKPTRRKHRHRYKLFTDGLRKGLRLWPMPLRKKEAVLKRKKVRRVVLGVGCPIYRQSEDKNLWSWIGIKMMPGRQMTDFKFLRATKIRLIAEVIDEA